MRGLLVIISFVLFQMGCVHQEKNENVPEETYIRTVDTTFQQILDHYKVNGVILVLDGQQKEYYSNDFEKASLGNLPASTFKIAHTIIGLEMDLLNVNGIVFPWDGVARNMKIWDQDFDLKSGFQASCVPCYQNLARKIGLDSMLFYLDKIAYGGMDVNKQNLDNFWLEGNSRISPEAQVLFLKRLTTYGLDVKKGTSNIMKHIMLMEATEAYSIYGKTGWSITDAKDNGWFVGYYEQGEDHYYFASNINPGIGFDRSNFANIRKLVVKEAIESLNKK